MWKKAPSNRSTSIRPIGPIGLIGPIYQTAIVPEGLKTPEKNVLITITLNQTS